MNPFQSVALRQSAVFISNSELSASDSNLKGNTALLIANLAKLGYMVTEPLLMALNQTSPDFQDAVLKQFREVMGINKNWTPLVKGWDVPTGESIVDHILTFYANLFGEEGTLLQCGHIIPEGTFPLERYNGCPFCGTPFEFGEIENYGQGSKKKMLQLWTEKEAMGFYEDLLASKTALDATQMDSLLLLLGAHELPEVEVGMKETLMAVIDYYVNHELLDKAAALFKTPTDILRYLWYKHVGFFQIVEPKVIVTRKKKNNLHIFSPLDKSESAAVEAKKALKLKYTRKEGRMVAQWLNDMAATKEIASLCEIMHPKRNMWVRFIRALRLAEFSKLEGMEALKKLLDVFYRKDYDVWQARFNEFYLNKDVDKALALLKERPGMFARSLFGTMLCFGKDKPVAAFAEIIDKVPARLLFTLNMYANNYFNPNLFRTVKPLGSVAKTIPNNKLTKNYSAEELEAMKLATEDLCLLAMKKRFAAMSTQNKSMFIEPMLFKMPVSIGDRSENVQDLPSALMGARFPVEGDSIRLFMQWGTGLPAMHLDMDLSCNLAYEDKSEYCAFYQLVATGCKHSGDIRRIPEMIGTAEYIEIDIPKLEAAKVLYVTFTCNAYSSGAITPNLVLGWMDSKNPMSISETTGVAYDPSCVQHQVRITHSLAKGLVFGVLEVASREVIWLEMPFQGQVVNALSRVGVESLLKKLDSKLSIGSLLTIKAEAQGLELKDSAEGADEVYSKEWAVNTAAVTKLLVD